MEKILERYLVERLSGLLREPRTARNTHYLKGGYQTTTVYLFRGMKTSLLQHKMSSLLVATLTFAKSSDPDQNQKIIGPYLEPTCLTPSAQD